ncbi:ABC transporter substrate-binding protein [Nocardioides mangrovi]|uniref:ABC transporter substrate-binding protein n=1 Tax=Nocardioides mangrovi TaxID=2874580 RepID=A0ABS7UDE0_9ACTN|nr:ABC transporter substrate-binding protein [Nocardioides mangrovi]MBZ5738726.1 ABC transporter substrate-binding protein [Nocardioides mangrovi]
MRRPSRLTAALAVLALTTLAACSSGSDHSGTTAVTTLDPDKDVTITWWTGQDSEADELLQKLADEYTADHPNVTIDLSPGADTTDDLLQKLQAGFASGDYPDVSYTYGSWASVLGKSGRTLDISDQVAQPDAGWDEFPEAARATATVDGQVIGLPAVVDNLGLIYNTELFDEAGLDYPTDDWTWDDFRAAAKALTDPSKNQFGTAYPTDGGEDTVWRFWPQVWQNGGDVLDDDGMPAFNSQAGVDALEYWRELAVDDQSVYLDQTDQKFEPNFYAGHIGMLISGPWVLYDLKSHKTPYAVAELPGTDGSHQTISGPDLWTLYDHDDSQRAAATFDFINWLTQPAQDVRWNLAYGNLPLRSSAADTPEFAQYGKDYPGADVFFKNLENATTPRPTVVGYTAMSRAVGSAISDVLRGDGDPQDKLDEAADAAKIDLQ